MSSQFVLEIKNFYKMQPVWLVFIIQIRDRTATAMVMDNIKMDHQSSIYFNLFGGLVYDFPFAQLLCKLICWRLR